MSSMIFAPESRIRMSTQVDADLTVLATGSDLLSLAASHAFAGDGGAFSLVDSLQTASVNPSFRILFSSTADGKKEDNKVVLTTISGVADGQAAQH
ncbi:hypothetical protein Pmar_PMAR016148 [Perkinsus marinus ATCC 50983]|uniref:Uncharacterized protein n=1 Tax=Perkinsus marinus (strain ATCC 50983 / TXsc) TaxID=423536 RepID=C5LZ62_PERM5|nr:hypothetical protein Pmar_PMAR016148 [Perkinsus marinus ATCC 50983]EEQ98071.1 hypothetical protein Pmar_PMAR016148 [Perkinsus marinus ATCC 50983]|eukprot:XP_002765354.1 hypothetical protein Pmar_PMAR016148 [Perkinsus marinus ATCC 50983]